MPALLTALAELRDYQGRYGDALKLSRQLLALNPNDYVTANRLAWLIAVYDRPNAAEALRLMNQAIDRVRGPLPQLLETRALVYLALNRPVEAIQDLQNAVTEEATAVRYFHLALASRAAQNRQEARDALETARALGLDPARLHPLEQPAYRGLLAELGAH